MSETTETKSVTSTKAKGEIGPSMIGSETVSYTHLTLPTTPYV